MDNSTLFALIILFLPFTGFLYQLFFGKKLGAQTHFVSLGMMGVVLALSLSFFVQLWMFLTPVVYPLSEVPEKFRIFIYSR